MTVQKVAKTDTMKRHDDALVIYHMVHLVLSWSRKMHAWPGKNGKFPASLNVYYFTMPKVHNAHVERLHVKDICLFALYRRYKMLKNINFVQISNFFFNFGQL